MLDGSNRKSFIWFDHGLIDIVNVVSKAVSSISWTRLENRMLIPIQKPQQQFPVFCV